VARRAKLAAQRGVPVADKRITIGGNKTDAALVNWIVAMRSMDYYITTRKNARRLQESARRTGPQGAWEK